MGTAKGPVSVLVLRSAGGARVLGNEEEEPRKRHRKAGRLLIDWRAGENASLGRHSGLNLDSGSLPSSNRCWLAFGSERKLSFFFFFFF